MFKLDRITDSLAGRSALAGGAAFAADGVVQLVHSQNSGADVVGVAGYMNLSLFIVGLVLISPAFIALARYTTSKVAPKFALAAASGTFVLGVTCVTSLIHGSDYGFFNVLAPLTNAAWLVGSIVLAVTLKRAKQVPTLVAVGMPIAWIAIIPVATFGGGLVAGAYWMLVGAFLSARVLQRTPAPVAQAA
jgi:hypothetical protein